MVRLGDLYEAINDDEAHAQLPAMVAQLVDARSGNVQRIDRSGAITDYNFSYFNRGMMEDHSSRFAAEPDVWTSSGLASGILNRAVPVDEIVPESVFRASSLWNDFFRFHGDDTGHSLGLVHRLDGKFLVTSFHRSWRAGAFSRSEAARLDAIGTDLHRIYRARDLVRRQTERSSRLANMLDAHQDLVFLVDASVRLIEASPAAMRVLDSGDGVTLRHGRFTVDDSAVQTGICRAVANTVNRRPVGRTAFLASRPSGKAPWRMMVLPAADARCCSLILSPSDRDQMRQAKWMEECFFLTKAEIVVAQGLLAGRTAGNIASVRRSSIATVRTHIRHILEKTGTRRITDLITLLAGLP